MHSVHERVERLVAAESRCDHRWAIRELAIASSSWATATYERHRHDAIATVPVRDAAQDGVVIDVMREGYLIGDLTLRPAGVAVGKKS